MEEDQIILIDKPAGISSFGVVAKIRGYLKAKCGHKVKVGHTGTLDPFATGLLILLTGKNTKKSSEFLKLDKVYEATLKLGFISPGSQNPANDSSPVNQCPNPLLASEKQIPPPLSPHQQSSPCYQQDSHSPRLTINSPYSYPNCITPNHP